MMYDIISERWARSCRRIREGRQIQADEGHMKPADKKADGEQPKSLGVKSLLQRIFSVLRERSGCGVRCGRAILTQSERKRNHAHRGDTERSRPEGRCVTRRRVGRGATARRGRSPWLS